MTQGDTLNQAVALSNRALAYRQLSYIDDGVTAAENSVALVESIGRLTTQGFRIYGQTLNTQGSLYLAQGQTRNAWQAWKNATEQYQQADYFEGVVKSLLNQAQALRSLGFFRRSSDRISQVKTLLEDQPDSILKAELSLSMGETQRLLGNLDESEEVLKDKLEFIESLNPSDDLATRFYLSLGNTQRSLAKQEITSAERTGQQIDKIEEYRDALSQYQRIPRTGALSTYIHGQLNQLAIFIEISNWTDAQALYTPLLTEINELPPGRSSAFSRLTLAHLLLDVVEQCKNNISCPPAGILADASQQSRNLLTTVSEQTKLSETDQTPSDPVAYSYALGYLGHLDELEKNNPEAQQLTEQALNFTNQPSINYQWNWQLGRLSKNQIRKLWYYDKAFQDVKKVRNDIAYVSPDARFDFRDRIEPLYREYISLLLPENSTTFEGDPKQLRQAQTVINDLRVAELQSLLACGLLQPDDGIPRADIQDIVSKEKNTAIIYPIILPDKSGEDRLEVLVQLPDKTIKRYKSRKIISNTDNAKPASPIEEKLDLFRKELEQPYFSSKRGKVPAADLYDWLIRPAEKQNLFSESIDTLTFVLDGVFRNIPMAALYDKEKKQFLIEKYAVAVTFGNLKLPESPPETTFKVLTAGLSDKPQLPKFGPLPFVKKELDFIRETVPDTDEIQNQSFTQKSLKTALDSPKYNVVHLATHGQFGD
ncbi:MAG: CHAT domain-containing protein, partial [Cyanobacteria bacterium J06636_28]